MTCASERTTAEAIAHGRQWLAAGWTWMPGQVILIVAGDGSAVRAVVCALYDGRPVHVAHYGGGPLLGARGVCVPDMRDPGTRGHDLAQVREAWDNPRLFVEWVGDGWRVMGGTLGAVATTESEALLAARRAAP